MQIILVVFSVNLTYVSHFIPLAGWQGSTFKLYLSLLYDCLSEDRKISMCMNHDLGFRSLSRTIILAQECLFQVALDKPSGLQVLPKGLFQQRTVLAQLQLKDWKMATSCCSKRKDVQSHPVPVHRLGRGTSGLFLTVQSYSETLVH